MKRRWRPLVLASGVGGALVLGYFFQKPLTYTAKATFKGCEKPGNQGNLTKALEMLGKEESYASLEEPKVFLKSYPVVKGVAKRLALQAAIAQKESYWHALFNHVRAEKAHREKPPHSRVLAKSIPVARDPLIANEDSPLKCTAVDYEGEVCREFAIHALDERTFEVIGVGSGVFGEPFVWKEGSFVLEAPGEIKEQTFQLTLLPLHAVIKSLMKTIQVKQDQKDPKLVDITYSHPSRSLAAAVVNAVMYEYQLYLKREAQEKVSHQLSYLLQRESECLSELETLMEEHKEHLEKQLEAGKMMLLGHELDFFTQKQIDERTRQSSLRSEIQRTAQALNMQTVSFESLLEKSFPTDSTLSVEEVQTLLSEYKHALDRLEIKKTGYIETAESLKRGDFAILSDPELPSEKMLKLHHQLIDERNWTAKEQELIEQELELERVFLIKRLGHLTEGIQLEQNVLEKRIASLQEALIHLLIDEYKRGERHLTQLAKTASSFPTQWLIEQKIEANTALQSERFRSFSHLAQSKNLGYHLDYLSAKPLMEAKAPSLPNPPHLLLGCIAGALLGGGVFLACLALWEALLGPRATRAQLLADNRKCLTASASALYFELQGKAPLTTLTTPLTFELAELFGKSGESVLLVEYFELSTPEKSREFYTYVQADSTNIIEQLEEWKKRFTRLLFYTPEPLPPQELQLLSDQLVIDIRPEQRIRDFENLLAPTLFLVEPEIRALPTLNARLARLIARQRKPQAPRHTPSRSS